MNHFRSAVEYMLKHEGGYVDHPNDPGGATNWGISLRWWRSVDVMVQERDIEKLTRDKAIQLYRKHFWWDVFDKIEDRLLATKLFDMSVNMGHKRAFSLLQRAANDHGSSLLVDGVIGRKTLGEIAAISPAILMPLLVGQQARFYFSLADRKSSYKAFLLGWLRRAYEVPK